MLEGSEATGSASISAEATDNEMSIDAGDSADDCGILGTISDSKAAECDGSSHAAASEEDEKTLSCTSAGDMAAATSAISGRLGSDTASVNDTGCSAERSREATGEPDEGGTGTGDAVDCADIVGLDIDNGPSAGEEDTDALSTGEEDDKDDAEAVRKAALAIPAASGKAMDGGGATERVSAVDDAAVVAVAARCASDTWSSLMCSVPVWEEVIVQERQESK
jgi:hypothetical protein